jgi:hypothetical protein
LATGIEVFCQLKGNQLEDMIMIQASTQVTNSVLQAEAEAMLFAARLTSVLNIQGHSFFTDNKVLALAAAASSLDQVPWEIRRQIADLKNLHLTSQAAVYRTSMG